MKGSTSSAIAPEQFSGRAVLIGEVLPLSTIDSGDTAASIGPRLIQTAPSRTIADLERMLSYSPSASILLDLHGSIVSANPGGRALIHLLQGQALHQEFATLLHDEDTASFQWLLDDILEDRRGNASVDLRVSNEAGRHFWYNVAVSLVRDAASKPECFWLQATSIDHLKRAERAYARSEQRWSHAFESAGQGVWEADIASDTVYYSPTWRKLRGIGPHEHVDSSQEAWLSRIHPQDIPAVIEHINRPHTQTRTVFEYRERHRDGHYIWIQSRGSTVEFDSEGKPARIVGTDTDVTELKRTQSLTESLAHRLEMALSISQIGVFEVDLQTKAITYDPRLRQIFGMDPDAPITFDDFTRSVHPEDCDRVLAENADAIARRSTIATSFRILRNDGEVRILKSHATYFESADGTPILIGTNWDVTEEVRLQESLVSAKSLSELRYAELENAKQRIEKLAMLDPLTNLWNRRHLDQMMQDTSGPISILHLDLDRFKQINDNHGHLAGDAVLRHVAAVLRSVVPFDGCVARIGGDEFVLLRRALVEQSEMEALAETIRLRLMAPLVHGDTQIIIGTSIGIAIAPDGCRDSDRLLNDADAALYRAKQSGRGRFEMFTPELRSEIEQTKRTAEELLRSVHDKEFVPYYQPVIDAKTFKVAGVEALARWQHPDRGVLAPSSFLRAADELNVLAAIDSIVLEKTASDLKLWRQAGIDIPAASVNISFGRLKDDRLLDNLSALDFEPGTLSFELLESIFLDDTDDCFSSNLEGIRRLGIGIDIDDFGTGHTSFLSLFRLNPGRFKIDRQLIAPILDSPDKRQIAASIIGIGKTLGIKVVAEGVETMEHAQVLKELGCDYLQGFAFARPLPADELVAWTRDRA